MARKTVELVTCDVCGASGAKSYALASGASRARAAGRLMDLCEAHASPIVELLGKGKRATITIETGRVARSAPRAAKVQRKIYTPEELDALEEKESKGK